MYQETPSCYVCSLEMMHNILNIATFSLAKITCERMWKITTKPPPLYSKNEEIPHHVFLLFFPGLQDVLPEFLRGRFVEAALSYVACNSEGELLCRNNDCWCRCSPRFPECNCPFADIKVMEENLEKSKEAWSGFNQEFMESGTSWMLPMKLCLNGNCHY